MLQLGLTKQESQRRTQVVELLEFRFPKLPFCWQVEPHSLAVADKQLLFRRTVFPPHLARLFQPQGPRFDSLRAFTSVNFGEVSLQAAQAVLVVVDRVGELLDISSL